MCCGWACLQVEKEMEAYKLYNVVPRLLTFIEQLTNIYVRFNRKRLKGAKGPEDTARALGTLYSVLMTLCKCMAPCTPFFTETMYQNLRRYSRQNSAMDRLSTNAKHPIVCISCR